MATGVLSPMLPKARAGSNERRHFWVMRSIKKRPAQELEDSEAFSKKGLRTSLQVAQGTERQPLTLRDGGSSPYGILKAGIALAGSVGVAGLDFQPAVGQAGEHLKTNKIFDICYFILKTVLPRFD